MKTTLFSRMTLCMIAAGLFCFVACKKDANNTGGGQGSNTSNANMATQADDQQQISNEDDNLSSDAETALNSTTSVSGYGMSAREGQGSITTFGQGVNQPDSGVVVTDTVLRQIICDATIEVHDSAGIRTITITYDGTNCWGNRTRTGTIIITIPNGKVWETAGATATLTVQNLTITRLRDNKVIVINGSKTITNVSGGLLIDLYNNTMQSIMHQDSASWSVTFPNGATKTWNVDKQRVFTYNSGYVETATGLHVDSLGNTDVAEWGTTRFGLGFESEITQPKVIEQSCDFQLTSGQNTVITTANVTAVITYGLNSAGDPTGCPADGGSYYYELVVTRANGLTYTLIAPY